MSCSMKAMSLFTQLGPFNSNGYPPDIKYQNQVSFTFALPTSSNIQSTNFMKESFETLRMCRRVCMRFIMRVYL